MHVNYPYTCVKVFRRLSMDGLTHRINRLFMRIRCSRASCTCLSALDFVGKGLLTIIWLAIEGPARASASSGLSVTLPDGCITKIRHRNVIKDSSEAKAVFQTFYWTLDISSNPKQPEVTKELRSLQSLFSVNANMIQPKVLAKLRPIWCRLNGVLSKKEIWFKSSSSTLLNPCCASKASRHSAL